VSFDSEVRNPRVLHDETNFGIGPLAAGRGPSPLT
jgi:hypothetical protein